MAALMIGVGLIVAFVLGATGTLGLLSGAGVSMAAILGLVVAEPPAPRLERSRPEYPLAEAEGRELATELRSMLDQVRPRRLDLARSALTGESGSFVLAHDARPDWDIEALMDEAETIVFAAGAHEHFLADDSRAGVRGAVSFIAELLRGEIEVERAFRGRFLTRIDHWHRDGRSVRTVPLTGAPLLVFLKRRIERERPDFEAQG